MFQNNTGQRGEDLAADYLSAHGYKIIDRNVYFRASEIDIVAEKHKRLIFVEVKTRWGRSLPAEAVTRAKREKLFSAIHQYLNLHGHKDFQLDVIAINFLPRQKHSLEHYEQIGLDD